MAYDTGAPSQIAYENVTIVVNRNPNAPFFSPSSYSRVVGEDFAPGSSLFQLTASDNDGVSIQLHAISDNMRCAHYCKCIISSSFCICYTHFLTSYNTTVFIASY